jgi:sugar/nucleoside kinase (ribokinase family)
MNEKKIIGIGNALMDIVVKLNNDETLSQVNLPRGSMMLVDAATSKQINKLTDGLEKKLAPGGSVANTIDGIARLGGQAAFIGKVGDDEMGTRYRNGFEEIGVKTNLFVSSLSTGTGLATGLVSPDGERTFGTYLGAAVELSPDDLSASLFEGYDIAYIEGYLVQNHALVRRAAELCKAAGLTIAIDLASYNVVEANLGFLKEIVRDYVDIIFANEEEAKAFTGKSPLDAAKELSGVIKYTIVKIGSKGSYVIGPDKKLIEIGTIGNPCIDSTGAGDLYASGFLYGLSKGLSLDVCGKIAAITSGHVITVYGARMDEELWEKINQQTTAIAN